MLVFDIETGPLSRAEIESITEPFDPSTVPHPGEFDPSSVKLGQLKDEAKIRSKIESAREAHAKAVANHARQVKAAEQSYWTEITDKAALNPMLGQVLAIGYYSVDKGANLIDGQESGNTEPEMRNTEPEILTRFWVQYEKCRKAKRPLVGFNTHGFDLPFLIKRSWRHEIMVPSTVLPPPQYRYFDPTLIDLRAIWNCGEYRGSGRLDDIAKFLGIGGKPKDGTTGADFARLWDEDRCKAKAYLINDLAMTARLASKLGVL